MNMSEASREHTGSSEVFCQGCGSRNDESFAYCVVCGSELGPRREARQGRTKDGDRRSNGDLWSWIGDSANLMYGQRVLVVARWILVVSGLLLALLNPVVLGEVKIQVGLILTLAVANFFLHVQLIRNQPSLPWVAYLASAVDVLAITMMVVTSGGGASSLYVFYFPALFAISVAFRPRAGLVLSGAAIGMYSLIASTQLDGDGGAFVAARIVMMSAVVVCGMLYRKIEGDRRRESEHGLGAHQRASGGRGHLFRTGRVELGALVHRRYRGAADPVDLGRYDEVDSRHSTGGRADGNELLPARSIAGGSAGQQNADWSRGRSGHRTDNGADPAVAGIGAAGQQLVRHVLPRPARVRVRYATPHQHRLRRRGDRGLRGPGDHDRSVGVCGHRVRGDADRTTDNTGCGRSTRSLLLADTAT